MSNLQRRIKKMPTQGAKFSLVICVQYWFEALGLRLQLATLLIKFSSLEEFASV